MSSLPLNGDLALSNFFIDEEIATGNECPNNIARRFPASERNWQEKQARALKHIATCERLADVRPASLLEVRPRPEMISSGVTEIDATMGALPRGCLSEICGAASSGKTSVLLATMAAATRREESCVLIDASDSFDPESGAVAGIDFRKLLWVRCGKKLSAISYQPSAKNIDGNNEQQPTSAFFPDDRRPKTDDFSVSNAGRTTHDFGIKTRNEHRLEQVLKTTDLVLQSGGFGLIALDLAGIPEKFVRRVPLASWFRFQRAVEHTKTALLVVSEFPCAHTCASVVLRLSSQPSVVSPQSSAKPSHAQLLDRVHIEVELARTRLERKPMQSVKTNFETRAVRAR